MIIKSKNSFGFELEILDKDKNVISSIDDFFEKMKLLKKELENYVKSEIRELAPNFSFIAGEDVALMLLSHAGSLKNLAKMSASTIQLLGSEKALFRHLKSGKKAKPPKHGVIYNSPYIKNAPPELRGKIARIFASKISLAIKIDFYTQRDERENLKKRLIR